MTILACILLFSAFGAWRAWRRKGSRLDILHYAATHAFLGLIVGVILTIGIGRAV